MTFAGRLDQILATRKREEQFSGAILVERGEAELLKAECANLWGSSQFAEIGA